MDDVDIEGSYVCERAGVYGKYLYFHFCCEPKSTIKKIKS